MCDELNHSKTHSLDVVSFYGVKKKGEVTGNDVTRKHKSKPVLGLPPRLNSLLGPTQVWKVFKKQAEALEFGRKTRSGVMTFSFQQSDGARLFLVAHPKIFWHYDIQKSIEQRCAYEVIPESTACKLYFDIEFETLYNPDKEGSSIVDTFVTVIIYFLSKLLNIQTDKEHVLNLDSSTDKKFSCHLIFQLYPHVFSDNKSAGAFVDFVWYKLNSYFDASSKCLTNGKTELNCLSGPCGCCTVSGSQSLVCIKDIGLSSDALKALLVFDRKGNKRPISDLSVYSKNRHFRLFQNTKWGKNSPLVISKDNCYLPQVGLSTGNKCKTNHNLFTETVFLDSLITYFRNAEQNVQEVKVIDLKCAVQLDASRENIGRNFINAENQLNLQTNNFPNPEDIFQANRSPYPIVDDFINSIVYPGHIWRSTFFNSSSVIVYDIIGNRYCYNINRQHLSNNVKYVVNLVDFIYYQKCHDPECSSFRSESRPLPPELKFQLEDEVFDCETIDALLKKVEHEDNSISDCDLLEATSAIEDLSAISSDDEL